MKDLKKLMKMLDIAKIKYRLMSWGQENTCLFIEDDSAECSFTFLKDGSLCEVEVVSLVYSD